MATIDSPTQPSVSAEIEPTFRAMRMTPRPLEYIAYGSGGQTRVLGHYSVCNPAAGVFAWASQAVMVSLMNPVGSQALIVLLRAFVCATVVTAVTAQRNDPFLMQVVRGANAGGYSTNSSTLTLTNSPRSRSNMPVNQQAFLQNATAAAGMSGAGGTGDTQDYGMAGIPNALIGVGSGTGNLDVYNALMPGQHPLVLSAGELVSVQWGVSALATGTVAVGFGFTWAEVPEF